jgi:hypothetical protein
VVTVPVCKKNMGKSNITFSENRWDQSGPFWNTLTGVDDESVGAGSDNICICAL